MVCWLDVSAILDNVVNGTYMPFFRLQFDNGFVGRGNMLGRVELGVSLVDQDNHPIEVTK
jgi:hypothetical protein